MSATNATSEQQLQLLIDLGFIRKTEYLIGTVARQKAFDDALRQLNGSACKASQKLFFRVDNYPEFKILKPVEQSPTPTGIMSIEFLCKDIRFKISIRPNCLFTRNHQLMSLHERCWSMVDAYTGVNLNDSLRAIEDAVAAKVITGLYFEETGPSTVDGTKYQTKYGFDRYTNEGGSFHTETAADHPVVLEQLNKMIAKLIADSIAKTKEQVRFPIDLGIITDLSYDATGTSYVFDGEYSRVPCDQKGPDQLILDDVLPQLAADDKWKSSHSLFGMACGHATNGFKIIKFVDRSAAGNGMSLEFVYNGIRFRKAIASQIEAGDSLTRNQQLIRIHERCDQLVDFYTGPVRSLKINDIFAAVAHKKIVDLYFDEASMGFAHLRTDFGFTYQGVKKSFVSGAGADDQSSVYEVLHQAILDVQKPPVVSWDKQIEILTNLGVISEFKHDIKWTPGDGVRATYKLVGKKYGVILPHGEAYSLLKMGFVCEVGLARIKARLNELVVEEVKKSLNLADGSTIGALFEAVCNPDSKFEPIKFERRGAKIQITYRLHGILFVITHCYMSVPDETDFNIRLRALHGWIIDTIGRYKPISPDTKLISEALSNRIITDLKLVESVDFGTDPADPTTMISFNFGRHSVSSGVGVHAASPVLVGRIAQMIKNYTQDTPAASEPAASSTSAPTASTTSEPATPSTSEPAAPAPVCFTIKSKERADPGIYVWLDTFHAEGIYKLVVTSGKLKTHRICSDRWTLGGDFEARLEQFMVPKFDHDWLDIIDDFIPQYDDESRYVFVTRALSPEYRVIKAYRIALMALGKC